jgi:hypothetical protein
MIKKKIFIIVLQLIYLNRFKPVFAIEIYSTHMPIIAANYVLKYNF